MEEALAQTQTELTTLEQQHQQLTQRRQQLKGNITNINDELDICFSADNDALAKVLIKRKLETLELIEALNSKQNLIDSEISDKKSQICEREPILEAMKQKLDAVSENQTSYESKPHTNTISNTDIEIALLREKRARNTQES